MSNVQERANASAVVILKKGQHIGTVRSLRTKSAVMVEVWEMGKGIVKTGKAGGWGYDKYTAALAGATLDGVRLFNHCGQDEKTAAILKAYHAGKLTEEQAVKKAAKIGARLNNYGHGPEGKAMSCYYESGLERMRKLGYTIIQAL